MILTDQELNRIATNSGWPASMLNALVAAKLREHGRAVESAVLERLVPVAYLSQQVIDSGVWKVPAGKYMVPVYALPQAEPPTSLFAAHDNPSIPEGTVEFRQDGKLIGKIINIEAEPPTSERQC